MLGAPWLSRALGDLRLRRGPRRGTDHRCRPVAAMGRPVAGGDRVPPVPRRAWLAAAAATATPCDPEWLDSWREREVAAQAAIAEVLGADLSEPLVARSVHRYAAETGATLVVAASMPIRDLEWYAAAHPTPPRVLANRGANGIDGVVSTALGVAASGAARAPAPSRCSATWPSSTTSRGWSTCPRSPARSSCSTTAGEGSSRSCRRRAPVEPAVFEQLFGTPPDQRHRRGRARVRTSRPRSHGAVAARVGAGRAQRPPLVRVRVPGRAENVALHDAINQAVRLALQ